MCGIVGAIAQRDVAPILLEGLRRLEYRGYDSAGMAVLDAAGELGRRRATGKVAELAAALDAGPLPGGLGIAHTRWATHGKPTERNAHPHICNRVVAVVHNGIIENHDILRDRQKAQGYRFTSETDTEVIVHQIHHHLQQGQELLAAVQAAVQELEGAYALGVVSREEPQRLIAARRGSPLVIGVGVGENFIASDVAALVPVTQRFIFLEDGDVAEIRHEGIRIFDAAGQPVERPVRVSELSADAVERGPYRHFMLKEIFEQPRAVADCLEGRISNGRVLEAAFGHGAAEIFDQVQGVHIIACGTSFHAGMVGRYWLEAIAGVPCSVEVASEFRYRRPVVRNHSLIVTLSQSGETADTLAGLQEAKRLGFGHSLTICNVPESSLVRESDLTLMTRAGPEIGVASTKAFTTQLVAMMLLVIALGRRHGMSEDMERRLVEQLQQMPGMIEHALQLNDGIHRLAERFADKHHALFLGRGAMYPVAMEGALKLKEISYIHAEAYPAGELKHGPLALIDADMPVIAVAPNDELLEKLKSNLQEVSARGGELFVFADTDAGMTEADNITVLPVAPTDDCIAPIVFTIPLQLLAYHVAVLKGTDVDQPRNLAKSVTVE
ncbi:glutamine--fructose-6-phosphate transaminase (isomerizing) [Thiohalobacter sp. IOR34]|uniref:glutamine--fructose-6-phosphate transaminase (isomerizing) n=1 Tax=Thiohalobacter sp. IOR34 TaxID=3057176 RepID=UPI0025B015FF|nr:glutamine--fructose-6-phosphate transaminase (isomerizing) [Thiohalobacter sp. IOR34]WJW75487.1 glutamine--fructose-6-phosphate transaminase (isomerizing) [Thiohalobacter sp. IOR34]